MVDLSLYNLIIMSISFLIIFTSFNTLNYIQKIAVESINEDNPGLNYDAYFASCIIYGVFSFSNFLVPSIHTLLSYKSCLFIASLTYLLYALQFFFPFKFGLNIFSALVGLGAGLLWTTQGAYLSDNSTSDTISRNAGIFWSIYQFSLVFGNLFYYFKFQGVAKIEKVSRTQTLSVLSALCLFGCLFFLFLKKNKKASRSKKNVLAKKMNPLLALRNCFLMFKKKKMIYLSISCFYTGLEQTFFGGVYATAVGYTNALGEDSIKYIGLYGVGNGFGAISVSILFGLILNRYVKSNRTFVYFCGFFFQLVAFFLIFLNHPNMSPIEATEEFGIIKPRIWIVLLCGFLMCSGDAVFNTQILSLIGTSFTDKIELSSAFALFKFTHSIAASAAFFYASLNITLNAHLTILIVFNVLGFIAFYLSENANKNSNENAENNENDSGIVEEFKGKKLETTPSAH